MEAFTKYNQFILYMIVPSRRSGKNDKMPINWRTGKVANAHDPKIWLSRDQANIKAKELGARVGFVFTKDDPFFFVDIDDCYDPTTNQWSTLALKMLAAFQGAAVEVSSGGRGLHIFGTGTVPPHTCRNAENKLEFYTDGRFVALTGFHATGDAGKDCSTLLKWLVETYFKPEPDSGSSLQPWTTEAVEGYRCESTDDELIERMLESKPVSALFGVTFRDLWEANEPVLAKAYPPNKNDNYNRSSADAALAQRLAFWTGKNCERIETLMKRSALVREKWERKDYLPNTIRRVCGRQIEVLYDKPPEYTTAPDKIQADDAPRPKLVTGSTFLTVDQQIDYFAGCVYVLDEHKVMIPDGQLLTPERFKAYYGGNMMPLDVANTKTTRNAFEAFTESQAFRAPRADSCIFRPDCTPGGIVLDDGRRMANIYHPVHTLRMSGEIAPFVRHIEKLFPDRRDQDIILAYLAAIIQYKGVKFQWCPLIQGVEGNGKTFLTYAIAFAIGQRYSHFPKAAEIASKFNDWLYARIFVGVEDIFLADSKFEVIEALKPMITGQYQEIEAKGGTKITRSICANFILNTNHKDGLRKTRNDRRFAPFYTPQQNAQDLLRDEMDARYFSELYKWARKCDGYAIIHDFLAGYAIPDALNPAHGEKAPQTSSTEAAIEQGMGRIEQEVLEAVAEGLSGFRGGWVSSIALDNLLVRVKADRAMPRRKRREMMESLGYGWHPALKDGRMTRNVQPDGSKPTLYLRFDHVALKLQTVEDIAKAYTEAQTKVD